MTTLTKQHRRAKTAAGLFDEMIVDNFAGGGGASLGIEQAIGRAVDIAINHDRSALAMHAANHPHTRHLCEDVWSVDPVEVCAGRPVGLVWLSPDCKHFSRAKGGKPVEKRIRGLAWIAVRWAKLARPRVLVLENVREFQEWGPLTDENLPCPDRKGLTFRRFIGSIRNLGYEIDWKVLNAADYGAPTHRRRLFIIARRDGRPIVWPEATHGPGRTPYRTAAECIDWSLPCHSIFLSPAQAKSAGVRRPLADKTMKRIAMGLKRYVIDNPNPFIVNIERSYKDFAGQSIDKPLGTITASPKGGKHALVAPVFTHVNHGGDRKAHGPDEPLPTITGAHRGEIGLVVPYLAANYGERPLEFIHRCGLVAVASKSIRKCRICGKRGRLRAGQRNRGQAINEPLRTVTPANNSGVLVTPFIARQNHGVKQWNSVEEPATTITTQDNKQVLVSAFLAKHYGGVVGHTPDRPLGTITAVDHHSLVAANLTQFRGSNAGNGGDPREPMPALTAQGNHVAEVRAFRVKYFGQGCGAVVNEPLHTVTARDRFGLVTVEGQDYQIIDIGLRMLSPRELARAQGFPDDYILTGSKSNQVAKIGNSVCPPIAEAIVRANLLAAGESEVA